MASCRANVCGCCQVILFTLKCDHMRVGTAELGYMGGLLLRYSHICVSVGVYSV